MVSASSEHTPSEGCTGPQSCEMKEIDLEAYPSSKALDFITMAGVSDGEGEVEGSEGHGRVVEQTTGRGSRDVRRYGNRNLEVM